MALCAGPAGQETRGRNCPETGRLRPDTGARMGPVPTHCQLSKRFLSAIRAPARLSPTASVDTFQ
jgi:hypothetical protein